MKKLTAVLLAMVLVLCLFTACGSTPSWEANEAFMSLTDYSKGEVISADFSSSCSIKIKDNNYENFAKYVEKLKKDGFEYLPFGSAPENYTLSDGSALWRCTNGDIYLQIMFNEDGTSGYEAFGCNVQIFGYDEIPETWKQTTKEDKAEEKDSADDNADADETKETNK